MSIWLPALWVATGICLFAGVHFLRAGRALGNPWLFRSFGTTSLVVAAYIALGTLMESPSDITSLFWLERLHVATACLVFPAAVWFISIYSRLRHWRVWVATSVVIFGGLLVANFVGPHSLLIYDVHAIAPLVLPWGEKITQLASKTAPFASVYYIASLLTFCWAFWRCFALWKQGEPLRARPLAIYLLLQLIASLYAQYVTINPRPSLNWDALPFLALVLLLSRALNQELRGYAVALDASNAALQEENARRAQVEARLRFMAYHDPASELPNRNALKDRLAKTLAERPRLPGALIVIDPERFGVINNALGHEVGDLLIREIGQRLSSMVGERGYVARLDGDEFGVVLAASVHDAAAAGAQLRASAKAMRDELGMPSELASHAPTLSMHMGLALFHRESSDGDELLRQAYAALQAAKASGHADPVIFAGPMQVDAIRKLRLETELRSAIGHDGLDLVYQPQVDRDGNLVGAEALLRWSHPELGAIPPMEFVRVAEHSGQMSALGGLVLRKAFATLAGWPDIPHFRLSVNISPWQLFMSDFLSTILDSLRDSAVDPDRITLEITETAFIHDTHDAAAKIHALDAMGIRVSVDDFGTGYASIASLKSFPVHELKIDQSFIRDMSTEQPDKFVAAMIALGRALDLHVVAEGVERVDQRDTLLRMGCDALQGYLIGRPAAAAEIARLLDRQLAVGAAT